MYYCCLEPFNCTSPKSLFTNELGDSDKLALHSFYSPHGSPKQSTQNVCKSEFHLTPNKSNVTTRSLQLPRSTKQSCGEYYKRYEHDETPVKDYTSCTETNTATGDSGRNSITNSELEIIETQVRESVSLDINESNSFKSLDSNIKFFKTTVQQIFDNFYTSMQDFELYKKKYQQILEKNKTESIAEMEDFIKDMIQHIMSSESTVSNDSRKSELSASNLDVKDKEINITSEESEVTTSASGKLLENLHSVVEAYKNDNYMTDSTLEENSSKIKRYTKKGEIFNIYLLNSTPYVEIKMNDRNLLSEINIKDANELIDSKVASAENIKKLAAKRTELEKYVEQQHDVYIPDRDIPIRISSAKKNIHLDEDFLNIRNREENKSFMTKICNYLCKKFRKNAV